MHMQKCIAYTHIPTQANAHTRIQRNTCTHTLVHTNISTCMCFSRGTFYMLLFNVFFFKFSFFKKKNSLFHPLYTTTSLSSYCSILGVGLEYLSLFYIIREVLYFQSSIGETYYCTNIYTFHLSPAPRKILFFVLEHEVLL